MILGIRQSDNVRKAFRTFRIFVVDKPNSTGRQWSIMPEFSKKSTSRFYKAKALFLCNLHKIPKKMRPGGPHPHMLIILLPAARGSQGRSSPVGSPYGNFFVESRSPVGSHIFPELFPFIRSGRICSPQSLRPTSHFNRLLVFYLPAQ